MPDRQHVQRITDEVLLMWEITLALGIFTLVMWPAIAAGFRPAGITTHPNLKKESSNECD